MIRYEVEVKENHIWRQARDDNDDLISCVTMEEASCDKEYFGKSYDKVRIVKVERTIVDASTVIMK